jgi:hypothetical protein
MAYVSSSAETKAPCGMCGRSHSLRRIRFSTDGHDSVCARCSAAHDPVLVEVVERLIEEDDRINQLWNTRPEHTRAAASKLVPATAIASAANGAGTLRRISGRCHSPPIWSRCEPRGFGDHLRLTSATLSG